VRVLDEKQCKRPVNVPYFLRIGRELRWAALARNNPALAVALRGRNAKTVLNALSPSALPEEVRNEAVGDTLDTAFGNGPDSERAVEQVFRMRNTLDSQLPAAWTIEGTGCVIGDHKALRPLYGSQSGQ